jgi:cytoskeletal protein CcmA (bactofilin family)
VSFWKKKNDSESASATPAASEGASEKLASTKKPEKEPSHSEIKKDEQKPSAIIEALQNRDSQKPVSSDTKSDTNAKGKKPEDSIADRFGIVRSALGDGTVIQGKLSFDTPVRIDGKLTGEIFSSKALIVGKTGVIDAKVEVACLIILGKVKGDIKATQLIELWEGGSLEGTIETERFTMEEGSLFNGRCKMRASQSERDKKIKNLNGAGGKEKTESVDSKDKGKASTKVA